MEEKPCKKEEEIFLNAWQEWDKAIKEIGRFLRIDPIPRNRDILPLSVEETRQFELAYKVEEEAHEKFNKAWENYSNCLNKTSHLTV